MQIRSGTIAALTYAAVVAAVVAWVAGAALAPMLALEHVHNSAPLDSSGINLFSALYAAYGQVCHQMPDRSIYIWGAPMAVCARCFGIYSGYLAGLVAYPLARALDRTDTPDRRWLFIAVAPVTIDFLCGYAGLFDNTLVSRAATGFIAGAAGAFFTLPGLVAMALIAKRNDKAPGY